MDWAYGSQFKLVRQGHIVTCAGQSAFTSDMGKCANQLFSQKIPDGYRPYDSGIIFAIAINAQSFQISIDKDGSMKVTSSEGVAKSYIFNYFGAWLID